MADAADEAAFGQVFALSLQGCVPAGIIYRFDNCPTADDHWRRRQNRTGHAQDQAGDETEVLRSCKERHDF